MTCLIGGRNRSEDCLVWTSIGEVEIVPKRKYSPRNLACGPTSSFKNQGTIASPPDVGVRIISPPDLSLTK